MKAKRDAFGTVSGRIYDAETNAPLGGAALKLPNSGQILMTNDLGQFVIPELPEGTHEIVVTYLGYEKKNLQIIVNAGQQNSYEIMLNPVPIEIEEITISGTGGKISPFGAISALDIQNRPLNSSQDILRMVPGLFIAQHAGGGKAEQIFLRGFDIDHGTDINLTVDGMPVNMVSHAHGQGYSDLHFLIPETVEEIEFDKGTYESSIGNFATAGYAAFKTKNSLRHNQLKLELGQFQTIRGLAMLNLLPNADNHHAYLATEYLFSEGYFEAPQNLNRLNLLAKYSGLISDGVYLKFSVSTFTSSWDASGQIPERAVRQGLITEFGAIDSTEGGSTGRKNVNVELIQSLDDGSVLKNQIYYSQYDFSLFSNFTFFLEDSINGDQIHQQEFRNIYGYNGSWEKQYRLGSKLLYTTAGLGLRVDDIRDNELSYTKNRTTTLETLALGDVYEVNSSAFIKQRLMLNPEFQIEAGLRYDLFRFQYENQLTEAYDPVSVAKGILSPKLNLSWSPTSGLQLYLNSGLGFHSNDTRVILQSSENSILPRAYSSDLGIVVKPMENLYVQGAVWGLLLDQEFVYVGDAGIVEPGDATRRLGADLSIRYQIFQWVSVDVDLNYTNPRTLGVEPSEAYIPLAPVFSSVGGINLKVGERLEANLRYRILGDRPANEDFSLVADGYQLFDAVLRYQAGPFQFNFSLENILNQSWKEAQFETESRLRGETLSVNEIHFTPGTPFNARLGISYMW